MKKLVLCSIGMVFFFTGLSHGRDLGVKGRQLVSKRPPFSLTLPGEFQGVYSTSVEHREENSHTGTDFFVRGQKKQIEEMVIVQIATKTNPQAGPMATPPLKPFHDKRMVSKGKIRKGDVEVEYLVQRMAWNPDSPSLQPILKKGWTLAPQWAMQVQILFQPDLDHAVLIRFMKDTRSFGLSVSGEEGPWNKEAITGNEKKVYETFQKTASGMIESLKITNP